MSFSPVFWIRLIENTRCLAVLISTLVQETIIIDIMRRPSIERDGYFFYRFCEDFCFLNFVYYLDVQKGRSVCMFLHS